MEDLGVVEHAYLAMIEIKHSDGVEIGSDRGFGLVFAVVFAIVGLWPVIYGEAPLFIVLAIAAACLALALLQPRVLRPLNVLWFRFGLLLGTVVTPIVMGLLYVTTIIPTAVALRFKGKDLLALRREPDRASYWVIRDAPGPAPGTMKRQF
jgi:predicted membrane metal-binding protein